MFLHTLRSSVERAERRKTHVSKDWRLRRTQKRTFCTPIILIRISVPYLHSILKKKTDRSVNNPFFSQIRCRYFIETGGFSNVTLFFES
jgi:hypothetical protein